MSSAHRTLVGSAFVLILLGIGTTDAVLTQDLNTIPLLSRDSNPNDDSGQSRGVQKQSGPDIFDALNEHDIVTEDTREESILAQIVPSDTEIESRVILKDNDRLAYFSWVESPDVKVFFTALKESLHTSFSSELQDLVDEVQEPDGMPVRNVLSFLDPAIHEERLLFVRVRQRMYEFHIAPGKEADIQILMDALTE